MLYNSTSLDRAIDKIKALDTPQAKADRWNKICRARSEEMNASERGRHFINMFGDPIDQLDKLTESFKK